MGIGSLFAAAAIAVGMGHAADAATYEGQDFNVIVRLTETLICDWGDCDGYPSKDYGGVFHTAPIGTVLRGVLSFGHFQGTPGEYFSGIPIWFSSHGNGDGFGGSHFDTNHGIGYYSNHDPQGDDYDFQISWDGTAGSVYYYYDEQDYAWDRKVTGTIELAPVPLPASAALLPLGLGALALIRRRRRAT